MRFFFKKIDKRESVWDHTKRQRKSNQTQPNQQNQTQTKPTQTKPTKHPKTTGRDAFAICADGDKGGALVLGGVDEALAQVGRRLLVM